MVAAVAQAGWAGLLVAADPALAGAATTTFAPQAGFWWVAEPITGLIPVPGVPAGGLYVASAPTGAQAEAAVRIPLPAGSKSVRLTLHVSALSKLNPPAVVGYPATADWPTGGPQPWSARPAYRAGAAPVVGAFSADDKTMTIEFPASDATAGIVLVPAVTSMVAPTFTVAFAAPTARDVTVLDTVRPSFPVPVGGSPRARPPSTPAPSPRRTPSPAASRQPRHTSSPAPSATPSASPSAHPRHASSTPPARAQSVAAESSRAASGDGTRNVVIAIGAAVVVAAGAALMWRRRTGG